MNHRTEYDLKEIGRNLRTCRERKNLSVEEVRQYLCVGSAQAIYKWEEGKCYPQADNLLALMELYDAELVDIIGVKKETAGYGPVRRFIAYQEYAGKIIRKNTGWCA